MTIITKSGAIMWSHSNIGRIHEPWWLWGQVQTWWCGSLAWSHQCRQILSLLSESFFAFSTHYFRGSEQGSHLLNRSRTTMSNSPFISPSCQICARVDHLLRTILIILLKWGTVRTTELKAPSITIHPYLLIYRTQERIGEALSDHGKRCYKYIPIVFAFSEWLLRGPKT